MQKLKAVLMGLFISLAVVAVVVGIMGNMILSWIMLLTAWVIYLVAWVIK